MKKEDLKNLKITGYTEGQRGGENGKKYEKGIKKPLQNG